MNNKYKSLVNWYYIEDWSGYPGPKGRVIPDAEGYDNPNDYIIGSDINKLLDAINFINGGEKKAPFRDVARLKPLNTTGHQISNGKFSIEVELVPSGKVGEKLPNDSEYIQQINSFLEEKYPKIKLVKVN